jgi:hypothetical protein
MQQDAHIHTCPHTHACTHTRTQIRTHTRTCNHPQDYKCPIALKVVAAVGFLGAGLATAALFRAGLGDATWSTSRYLCRSRAFLFVVDDVNTFALMSELHLLKQLPFALIPNPVAWAHVWQQGSMKWADLRGKEGWCLSCIHILEMLLA